MIRNVTLINVFVCRNKGEKKHKSFHVKAKTLKNNFCGRRRDVSLIGTVQSSKGPPPWSFACPSVTSAAAPLSVCELCSGAGRVSAESETGRGSLMWHRQTDRQTDGQADSNNNTSTVSVIFHRWLGVFVYEQCSLLDKCERKTLFLSEIIFFSLCLSFSLVSSPFESFLFFPS